MRTSPLSDFHLRAQALIEPYGPVGDSPAVGVVQTYGHFEAEYAAIRKSAGLIDLPFRATLAVTGADRLEFLNRMLTQELRGAAEWSVRESFWLNRKGRIDADVRVIVLPGRVLLDCDVHAAARALAGLNGYIISEDVAIADVTERSHRLALHGPTARAVLARLADSAPGLTTLEPGRACEVTLAGHRVVVDRSDQTGEVGLELLVEAGEGAAVQAVYSALLEAAHEHAAPEHAPVGAGGPLGGGEEGAAGRPNPRPGLRPIGWAAFNIARIEAGTPLYLIDFGPDSLPAESGVLDRRVSFTKGCYLGQEIVARMHALGKPKQVVAALRLGDTAGGGEPDRQPVTGSALYTPESIEAWRAAGAPGATAPGPAPPSTPAPPAPVGAVTSSTFAPMLAQSRIALAMVRFDRSAAGTRLLCDCDGALLPAEVQTGLRFWPRAGAAGGADGADGAGGTAGAGAGAGGG
jgi:folate-binding protein YgfZ